MRCSYALEAYPGVSSLFWKNMFTPKYLELGGYMGRTQGVAVQDILQVSLDACFLPFERRGGGGPWCGKSRMVVRIMCVLAVYSNHRNTHHLVSADSLTRSDNRRSRPTLTVSSNIFRVGGEVNERLKVFFNEKYLTHCYGFRNTTVHRNVFPLCHQQQYRFWYCHCHLMTPYQ